MTRGLHISRRDKSGAICAHLTGGDAGEKLPADTLTAEGIEGSEKLNGEFYVIGKDCSWTYIVTHENESGIGPFFMSRRR